MKQYRFDVIIIGAGPAGVAAAGTLAGTGISVALIEAGVYAGAENWSGCVYFAESLAEPDCFGPEAVKAAPFERTVRRRGTLVHNSLDVVGVEYEDPDTFRNCYTVLRPVYDPYFASLAEKKGAVLLTETTVTSLIRKDGRVTGVMTNRGPLSAGVVFIAEGDASHLVRSEQLERKQAPHFLQGVKVLLSLDPKEIEKRFRVRPDEGAAYEILLRNPAIAGRTAHLNVGGFLYTNRDSLSLGYVVPLENVKKHYRGDHDRLLEWMRGLPVLRELTADAALSSYGTKIIRSGGWRERPVLVEDGLAVGSAAAGLGVDIPFPNFTGPAAATGLYFGRAVKELLKQGRTLDRKNLTQAYLDPLRKSVYGRNAQHLAAWPNYFSRSRVLFGRTADILGGSARFLSLRSATETGRFLRGHLLSPRALRESLSDTLRSLGSLHLWKPLAKTLLNPATLLRWTGNLLRTAPQPDSKLALIMKINGKDVEARSLPWPVGGMVRRFQPALGRVLSLIYANDGKPVEAKLNASIRIVLRELKLTDFIVLPAWLLLLILVGIGTALWDAFRYYALKTPAETMLAEPVMAHAQAQRAARDIDAVKPAATLDAKLATNTYRIDEQSHIRTLWPETIAAQPDMSQTALWWVCPARVYHYDAPLFGRGRVTVNFENCIKCESCWRAEPDRTLWGRHTEHRLVYRPESSAINDLLRAVHQPAPSGRSARPKLVTEKIWYLGGGLVKTCSSALQAAAAFRESVMTLPASADRTRRAWPLALGKRLLERLAALASALAADNRPGLADQVRADHKDIEQRLDKGMLFPALYCAGRLEELLGAVMPEQEQQEGREQQEALALNYDDVAALFPDRIVKEWEEQLMPDDWAKKLRSFIAEHDHPSRPAIRALSSVSPALGIVAARQIQAARILKKAGKTAQDGCCAVDAAGLTIANNGSGVKISGSLTMAPLAAATHLLLLAQDKACLLPLTAAGVKITATPGIGLRAAGFGTITVDCAIPSQDIVALDSSHAVDHFAYLAVALGAGDYLSRRAQEHATGRVQFPGQMLDTEGRDGIAKLGAVKAMVARIEAWRLLLETLSIAARHAAHGSEATEEFGLLCAAVAAQAFGPEKGCMAYDAGQVFGGFAYSEDDLLSRFYRDSSLFRFLAPGVGAAGQLQGRLGNKDLKSVARGELGGLEGMQGAPLADSAQRWNSIASQARALPAGAHPALAGTAAAMLVALRGLLARIEAGLNSGRSNEGHSACAEVLLSLAAEAVARAKVSAGQGGVSPTDLFPLTPTGKASPAAADYERFCTAPGRPHRSGTFLTTVFDRSPRYVPEMQLHDVRLRTRWNELSSWFREHCLNRSFDGLGYERHVEKLHHLPDDTVAAVKEKRWLATYIPAEQDGLGWHKAEYYILNAAAGSFGDAGLCLLIMASTSIGTTPILIGLDDELPRVKEELAPLAENPRALGEINDRLCRLIASLKNPNPAKVKKDYAAIMKLVDSRIRKSRVVKYLSANFLKAFYGAGIAGRRGDFGAFIANLKQAGELFGALMPDVQAALAELPRRERCHKFYLRTLGHGAVSAFALTEPTAGSDSGGVKTTAQLRKATLTPLPDGRYSFLLDEKDPASLRYLVDADRVDFTGSDMVLRTPDNGVVRIEHDRYDYGTDKGERYYTFQGKDCPFHDIGQARASGDGYIYEYYSLTGAKMWITNGSIATQFCLYALSSEGVTGFMVDRHAEGLVVGADESKTGQRGSPTNEIALDSVRVPREAVIGYEGHGQVNALETLNVGRCGLAVVSGALMHKLMDEALRNTQPSPERDRLLGEAAAVLFGSESLAFYLVGLFDRPYDSVRMESAIAKYLCSEDIHRLLSLLERAYGPAGQTEARLIEKARRDSRVLTIYEGTNEVQLFLLLKDLIGQAAAWPVLPEDLSERPGDKAAATLAKWKNRLGAHCRQAAALLGDTAWADAMLQPGLMHLSEMAGEILRLECIFYRLEWIERNRQYFGPEFLEFDASFCCGLPAGGDAAAGAYAASLRRAGKRAVELALARIEHLDAAFAAAWERTGRNLDTPDVVAADAAFDAMAAGAEEPAPVPAPLRKPLRVLCILRPVADLAPNPRLYNGALREILWKPDPLDLSAVIRARDLARGQETILDVLMISGAEQEAALRPAAAGAAHIYRLNTDSTARPAAVLRAVQDLEKRGKYDVITAGGRSLNGDGSL